MYHVMTNVEKFALYYIEMFYTDKILVYYLSIYTQCLLFVTYDFLICTISIST